MDLETLIGDLWEEAFPALWRRPPSPRPTLVVLAGVPLSGKSTLARALAASARTATLHVENDAVRERVARELGHAAPIHDGEENLLTYRVAATLASHALASGANAIHDATNLNEKVRRTAYEAAHLAEAPTVVVFVETHPREREERAAALPPTRQEAHAKLGHKRPNVEAATRPRVVLDGARPVEESVRLLQGVPKLAPLWAAEGPPRNRAPGENGYP